MAMANLAMATGNIGREGVGVNPLRGQNNVQGSCDMGSFPHEFPGYRHVANTEVREHLREGMEHQARRASRACASRTCSMPPLDGSFRGMFIQGEDIAQSDPNTHHVEHALRVDGHLIVQDLFLNETAAFAHVFLPGTSFLEKDGTFINAERRINRVRKVMREKQGMPEWEVVCRIATAMGYPMHYNSASEIMDEIARITPTFEGVSFDEDRRTRFDPVAMQRAASDRHADHAHGRVHARQGSLHADGVRADGRARQPQLPAHPDDRPHSCRTTTSARRRGAPRTAPGIPRTSSRSIPTTRKFAASRTATSFRSASRVGATTLKAKISDRMPQGVVYTTFHHPATGANVITTENSDWATNCPEYKVTAVQVTPSPTIRPSGRRNGRRARSKTSASRRKRGWSRRSNLPVTVSERRLR